MNGRLVLDGVRTSQTLKWPQVYAAKLGDAFQMITAFSRDTPQKTYVQHRLCEHAAKINDLIQQGAYFYVCGDAAHMAREVNAALGKILAAERGLPEDQGHELVKRLRSSNLYQVPIPYLINLCAMCVWLLMQFIGGCMVIKSEDLPLLKPERRNVLGLLGLFNPVIRWCDE